MHTQILSLLPKSVLAVTISLTLTACLQSEQQDEQVTINKNPFPSTYQPLPNQDVLITNATILTGTGERID